LDTDPTTTIKPTTITNPAYFITGISSSPYTNPDSATSEFLAEKYTNVQSEDDTYSYDTINTNINNQYAKAAHRFTFNTANYSGYIITDIVITWKIVEPHGVTPQIGTPKIIFALEKS
jgi:hypothetical protein